MALAGGRSVPLISRRIWSMAEIIARGARNIRTIDHRLTTTAKGQKTRSMGLRSPHEATAEASRPINRQAEDAPCLHFSKFPPKSLPAS